MGKLFRQKATVLARQSLKAAVKLASPKVSWCCGLAVDPCDKGDIRTNYIKQFEWWELRGFKSSGHLRPLLSARNSTAWVSLLKRWWITQNWKRIKKIQIHFAQNHNVLRWFSIKCDVLSKIRQSDIPAKDLHTPEMILTQELIFQLKNNTFYWYCYYQPGMGFG